LYLPDISPQETPRPASHSGATPHQPTYNHPYFTPINNNHLLFKSTVAFSGQIKNTNKKKLLCTHQHFLFITVGLLSPAKLCTRGMVS